MELGRFHVIIDVGPAAARDPFELARSVVRGGAPLVQIEAERPVARGQAARGNRDPVDGAGDRPGQRERHE